MENFPQYAGLPLMGPITIESGSKVLHISDTYETDQRDDDSLYVAATSESEKSVVFLFIAVPEQEGFLIQAIANNANGGEGKTDGMYLTVHNSAENDGMYPDFFRVIAHSDKEKAAIWGMADVGGQKYLQVKANPDETGEETVGWYMAVPPDSDRDETSNFVAVTSDEGQATSISTSSGGASFAAPISSYEQPEESPYEAEEPAYEAEEPSYEAEEPSYEAEEPSYEQAEEGYGGDGYGQPEEGYSYGQTEEEGYGGY